MNISEIRELSHLVRCGFIDKLKAPQLVCPEIVDLILKHSIKYKDKSNLLKEVKYDKNIRLSSLHILATYSEIFPLQTIQILSNQTFLFSIINIIQILVNENHEVITSETEQILALILFHIVEKEQPMFCRVAIKNGFLDLLIQVFMMPINKCLTLKLKNVILRVIVRMVRISPIAVSKTWFLVKKKLNEMLFSDDISMRLWSIKYISSVVRMLEIHNGNKLNLDLIQPLEMCPSIFILMYDKCLPIRLQVIRTLCKIIIFPGGKKESKQLVYMGIIGLFLDILNEHELINCTNSIATPILVSLIRLVKLSERWCMVFVHSNGIKTVMHYLKYPIEPVIISVLLLIYNISIYSSFYTNKILHENSLEKLNKVKQLVSSTSIINVINQIIFLLMIRCTEYNILHNFVVNCGDPHIIENKEIQDHLKKLFKINEKLNYITKFRN